MIAFYDLDISPVSYDFLHFLTGAQRAANGEPVHVVIVPGKNAGFKMFDHKPISRAEKQWRLGRVLLSSAALAGATVTVCPTREFAKQFETEGHFPPGYRVDFPLHHYSLSVAVDAAKAGLVISSTKSMTGHLLGGAGGVEAIFTVLALHHQVAPPTINLTDPDPECDLDYCANEARSMKIEVAMKNNFGFGGTNGTLLFRRA